MARLKSWRSVRHHDVAARRATAACAASGLAPAVSASLRLTADHADLRERRVRSWPAGIRTSGHRLERRARHADRYPDWSGGVCTVRFAPQVGRRYGAVAENIAIWHPPDRWL